ncbi:hypothetical protein JL720_10837 [Aureococcus anophagefferens]|jgi:hypothetical protein|uniref:Uncharacterized protein n=1 Tax=Aureococcus anophagefferens TaxID=44056 RepID=F0Y5D7_AURAN|nr:hypothetical protein AURANDRAFT_63093 [Aureococcus anophagefferens]EGB09474.1 hypothetical protein AURANDRAFT_63093 [Aureococcus anophagefferens]KAH8073766.1 hypothetical protein JL720_10837 [Aureococcus anophagefferens]|eukprot:XP_009035538.1 hypothetical protein AURANDRAFT_63093 [Aureococcus anophagefferens]
MASEAPLPLAPEGACPAAPAHDAHQSLLVVLVFSNMVLLFLVGLLSRRLERVNANVSRLLKATIMNGARPADAPAAPSPSPATPASPHAGGAASPVPESLARELVNGHVTMLKKTLSNESLRSSLSADDFASLQYMLGDEDGVNM